MFSFFERNPTAETTEPAGYDMSDPIPSAIATTFTIIECKLDKSRDWARRARAGLQRGDLHQHIGLLNLAKAEALEAAALMESADLLREELLNQQ